MPSPRTTVGKSPWIAGKKAARGAATGRSGVINAIDTLCSIQRTRKQEGNMRISDVKTYILGTAWRNLTYVEVHTDDGLVGVGEVRMLNHTDALMGYFAEAVPNHILGSDPFQVEDLVARMFRNDYARAGEIAMSAISTIEMACWDIVVKALQQPVYRLLGGSVREQIKAYANGWYTVERTPEEFHKAAKQVLTRGYRALKLDPFGAGFYELDRQ